MNNRGDTLVEVLIAMAIAGLVLGGSFVAANRSARTTRTAQERAEALKIAETQVERVRIGAGAGTLPPSGSFCFKSDGSLSPTAPCNIAFGLTYEATITNNGANGYTVKVEWDTLGDRPGTSKNSVQLDYETK